MKLAHFRLSSLLGAVALGVGFWAANPAIASAAEDSKGSEGGYTCSGTPSAPGVLAGTHRDVRISGFCVVNGGPTVVRGDLKVQPNSALFANFALNDVAHSGVSNLTVRGDVSVGRGAALIMGCIPTSFPCFDDPNAMTNPTLASADQVGGDLVANDALAVIVHNTTIGGDVTQRGGGGGITCAVTGILAAVGFFADYSDYEDSTVRGDISVSGLNSCWLGLARVNVGGDMSIVNNHFFDPDAIEILSNTIRGDLICRGNSMVWDSADLNPTGALWPRLPEPNTVRGERKGQCDTLANPSTEGGTPGPQRF
jgi:hypothetical protein